jgi:hypothetical protein
MTPEHRQRLREAIKFQKTLALAASASNSFEAEAAERAARRLMETYNIDPVTTPNGSLYNRINFADNALLNKLREEWRTAHPHYYYKTTKDGRTRRLRRKPKPKSAKPTDNDLDVSKLQGLSDDFVDSIMGDTAGPA